MVQDKEICPISPSVAIQLATEARVKRGAVLLATNGSCLVASQGQPVLAHLSEALSLSQQNRAIQFSKIGGRVGPQTDRCDAQPAVSFVCVPPQETPAGSSLLACLAVGHELHVVQLPPGPGPALAQLGTLTSAEATRWLGASWHPRRSGLLAAICQAEIRVALCTSNAACGTSGDGARGSGGSPAEPLPPPSSPLLVDLCSLGPPQQQQQQGHVLPLHGDSVLGASGGRALCRSAQCSVAWVGEHDGGAGARSEATGLCQPGGTSDRGQCVTLVVGWGPELELISWRAAELASAVAAAAAAATAGAAGKAEQSAASRGGSCSVPPASRRTLLLGVPGPLSAMVTGPYGSVLATAATGVVLAAAASAAQGGSVREEAEGSRNGNLGRGNGGSGALEVGAAPQQVPHGQQATEAEPEVVDLRGQLAGPHDAEDPGLGGAGPSLAALLSITAGAGLGDDALGGCPGRAPAGPLVPPSFLLPRNPPTSLPAGKAEGGNASLCVVWPGGLAASDGERTAAESAGGPAVPTTEAGFRSVAPLVLARPDLLSCCGRLVLVGSSVGPPLVAAYELDPRVGLSRLALLAPELPGLADPARCRLRGLVAAIPSPLAPPHCGAGSAAGPGGGGFAAGSGVANSPQSAERPDAAAGAGPVLVLVAGEMDPAAAGGGIVGFGRQQREPAGVRMAPLLAAFYRLPTQLAEAAAAATEAAGAAAAARTGAQAAAVPLGGTGNVARAPAAAAAASQATASPGPGSEALVAAVVGQLAELLGGLRAHVDGRLDALAGSLQAHAARLDRIEAEQRRSQQGRPEPQQ